MINTANRQIGGRREGAGPPRGNRNAQRHGLRSAQLPDGCKYIEHACNRLRRELEAAVGLASVRNSALIQSCLRYERTASLCEAWLRKEGAALPLGVRLDLVRTIDTATAARDRAIDRLLQRGQQPAGDPLATWQPPGIDEEEAA